MHCGACVEQFKPATCTMCHDVTRRLLQEEVCSSQQCSPFGTDSWVRATATSEPFPTAARELLVTAHRAYRSRPTVVAAPNCLSSFAIHYALVTYSFLGRAHKRRLHARHRECLFFSILLSKQNSSMLGCGQTRWPSCSRAVICLLFALCPSAIRGQIRLNDVQVSTLSVLP